MYGDGKGGVRREGAATAPSLRATTALQPRKIQPKRGLALRMIASASAKRKSLTAAAASA